MIVVDASVVVEATLGDLGVKALAELDEQLVAPWLLWSEVPSAIRSLAFRSEISRQLGELAIKRLANAPVQPAHPDGLIAQAWKFATEFGWAKTYDAEYLALARLLDCRLVTLDGPLWRRTRHLGYVVTPADL